MLASIIGRIVERIKQASPQQRLHRAEQTHGEEKQQQLVALCRSGESWDVACEAARQLEDVNAAAEVALDAQCFDTVREICVGKLIEAGDWATLSRVASLDEKPVLKWHHLEMISAPQVLAVIASNSKFEVDCRAKALEGVNDQVVLGAIARDPAADPTIRAAATGNILDKDVLANFAANRQEHPDVRLASLRRLEEEDLLRGISADKSEPYGIRLEAAKRVGDERTMLEFLWAADEDDSDGGILEHIQNAEAVADVAIGHRSRFIRNGAVARLASLDRQDILLRVVKECRFRADSVDQDTGLLAAAEIRQPSLYAEVVKARPYVNFRDVPAGGRTDLGSEYTEETVRISNAYRRFEAYLGNRLSELNRVPDSRFPEADHEH